MFPLHDNDLDRLSREAAEHFEVEPGTSGWAHLEKRLDNELPQKKKKRRFLFWLFLITATTGGALIGIIKYKPSTPLAKNIPGVVTPADQPAPLKKDNPENANRAGTAKNNQVTGGDATSLTPSQASTTNTPDPVTGNQEPATATINPKQTIDGNNQPRPATASTTTPHKNITKPVEKTNDKKYKPVTHEPGVDKTPVTLNYATITPSNLGKDTRNTTKRSKHTRDQQQRTPTGENNQSIKPVQDNTTVPDSRITATDQNTNGEPVDKNTAPSTAQAVSSTPGDPLVKNNTPAADSVKTPAGETVKKENDRKKDKIKQLLELGLMAGPDMSTVAFGPLYKTGYNFGLQIGYRFSNRWSVNTGIIYTKKFYQADSQHFHYKNPSWNWNLDKVKGNCSMWEIPVNVRYDVSFNDKRRWFVSTGLSTYLMDKEYYTLHYISSSGTPYPVPLYTDSNSSYLFSIWNLSVGMERSLGKRFSIQAEPYLKVPLKGLGTGSMRMDSYGILFTLKYKPTFKAKK
jgi:opacity protein-like surface antigen